MKIGFLGTPEFSVPTLKTLTKDKRFEIKVIVSQPDKPIGRRQILTPPPVKQAGLDLKIPVYQPKSKSELYESLKIFDLDFLVVIAYGMIVSNKVLNIPKIAPINVHASLLPKYRGASPIQQTLLNGDKVTGISIMKMSEKMDAGDIYKKIKIEVEENDNLLTLSEKLANLSAENLGNILEQIYNLKLKPEPQDENLAIYCKKIEKSDGEINFQKESAKEISNKLKAFTPWPGIHTYLKDKKIKILSLNLSNQNIEAGKWKINNDKSISIGTRQGSIMPLMLQPENKKTMKVEEFLNGYQEQIEQ